MTDGYVLYVVMSLLYTRLYWARIPHVCLKGSHHVARIKTNLLLFSNTFQLKYTRWLCVCALYRQLTITLVVCSIPICFTSVEIEFCSDYFHRVTRFYQNCNFLFTIYVMMMTISIHNKCKTACNVIST